MTLPQSGITHDVVIHVNNSLRCGLMTLPNTFHVRNAPTFLPKFAVGEPAGIDRGRWKSWIQYRFDGGAGQIFYSGTKANNRYAESNLVDLGMPVNVAGGLAGKTAARGLTMEPASAPEGLFAGAIMPRASTSQTPTAVLFTKTFPVFVFEHSNRPRIIHYKSEVDYTGAEAILGGGAVAAWQDPLLVGIWSVQTTVIPIPVTSVVKFSNTFIAAQGVAGLYNRTPFGAGAWYAPTYNTEADVVAAYDNRLWRGCGAKLSVLTLQAGNESIPAFYWSDYKEVGDQSVVIANTYVYGGKLFMGKTDGCLYVYDAGRIYPVSESFRQMSDPSNYKLMCEYKGMLYFNVRQRVYRYGVSGMFEQLEMPDFDGVVCGGCAVGDELHIVVQTMAGEGEVWIFNADTGGCRRWFTSTEYSWGSDPNNPQGIAGVGVAYGYEWILPVQASSAYTAGSPYLSGITAANRISPARTQLVPYFAKTHSYLIMSMSDLGYPDISKLGNRVNIDYGLYSTGDRIDVSFLTELKGPRLVGAFLHAANDSWTDGTAALDNGAVLAEEGALDVTTTQYDLYLLFESPVEAIRMIMGVAHVGIGGGTWSYWTGTVWNDISGAVLFYFITEAGDRLITEAGDYLIGTSEGVRINDGTLYLTRTGYMLPGSLDNWAPTTVQGVTGYPIRYTSPVSTAKRMQFTECVGVKSLRKQTWTSLGSIGSADVTKTKKSLSFPEGTTFREVMLMFDLWGTNATRPEVKRVEIEHIEEPSNLGIVNFTTLATDNLVLLNAETQDSGAFIAATLLSISRAPKLYVCQIPWPTVGATIRARVSIGDYGANVPVLVYYGSWGGALIPVQLDEM